MFLYIYDVKWISMISSCLNDMEYESKFLNLTKKCMICFGAWPMNLSFYMNLIYQTFRAVLFTYYAVFVITVTIGLKEILHANTKKQVYTFQYAFTYLFLFWKLLLCQNGKIREFMTIIAKKERLIMNGEDDGIKTEYRKCLKFNNRTFYILFTSCAIIVSLFIFVSAIEVSNWPTAEKTERELPLPQAFPFDDEDYFELQFYYQTSSRVVGAIMFLAVEVLLNSLIYFPAALLRVLAYNFRQFGDKISKGSIGSKAFLKALVLEHKEIIEYVIHLNDVLKWFLSVDFILRSYHISLILMDIMTLLENVTFDMDFFITISFSVSFLVLTFAEICCMYYNCNEIMIQSVQLGNYIFQSNWYDQSLSVKRSLLIVIIRSQKPLELRIGNLYPISNDLIVGFVKAGFTYVLLSFIDFGN